MGTTLEATGHVLLQTVDTFLYVLSPLEEFKPLEREDPGWRPGSSVS